MGTHSPTDTRLVGEAGLTPPTRAFGPAYLAYALSLLFLVAVFNYMDRYLLGILSQPIKEELRISDTALGLLTGAAFAVFYSAFAIPVARLADRRSRVGILSLSVAIWSVATALSGAAVNFVQLLLARIAVGCGEAGGLPPSHSMVADYFPPERRATPLAILGLGGVAGFMLANAAGGYVAETWGWRWAFLAVGAPGILVALVVLLTLVEPKRGASDPVRADTGPVPDLRTAIRVLAGRRAFVHVLVGVSFVGIAAAGPVTWYAPMFMRSYGVGPAEVGKALSVAQGVPMLVSVLIGGLLVDALYRRNVKWTVWVPSVSLLIAAPFVAAVPLAGDFRTALILLVVPALIGSFYLAPAYSLVQGLAGPHLRATAASLLLFCVNLVGFGAGPLIVGVLSDAYTPVFGTADSLRYAVLTLVPFYILGALHFFWAARTLPADLEAAGGGVKA